MEGFFERTSALYGEKSVQKFIGSRVSVFGLGGVGGACYEALLRAGIGHLFVYDFDTFEESNLNRQRLSDIGMIGKKKTDAALALAKSIRPSSEVIAEPLKIDEESVAQVPASDLFIDCVDDLKAKVAIIKEAKKRGIPVLVSLGMGHRKDPSKLKYVQLHKSEGDPLARRLRQTLRKEGIELKGIECVISTEEPVKGKDVIASAMPVPTSGGMLLAAKALQILSED